MRCIVSCHRVAASITGPDQLRQRVAYALSQIFVISLEDGTIANLDARTVAAIQTLDANARDRFVKFALLANATAATYGCTYLMISGNRTWAEQDALFAQGRSTPGRIVTNAPKSIRRTTLPS